MHHQQTCDTVHSNKELSHQVNTGQNAKGAEKTQRSESANQKESR